ncbi:hypothetical protein ACRBEV_24830 [Methylobacterium phyllosphaerae]
MRQIKAADVLLADDRPHRNGDRTMHAYRVTFYKTVADDAGHEYRVRQRTVLVRARSEVTAEWKAKALLCERAHVIDWRLRADSCEIEIVSEIAA